ncbi:MAG: response regulator [Spirochaetaceae bacterium]
MPVLLIADDETYIRDVIRRALPSSDYTILEASEGNEAIQILKDNHVDILILDLVMPQKGGIETFIEIRDTNKELKIIVITGKIRMEDDAIQGLTDHFKVDAVLSKPFDMEELVHLVKSFS